MKLSGLQQKIHNLLNKNTVLLITLLLPVIVAVMLIVLVVLYNFYLGIQNSKSMHLNSLQNFSISCESNISSFIKSCKHLESDSDISAALSSQESFSSVDCSSITKNLKDFIDANGAIYSIAILNKNTDEILSSDGLFSWDQYFNKILNFENRTPNYWRNFHIYDSSQYKLLPPIHCAHNGSDAVVIPVYFSYSGNTYTNQMLITINLNTTIKTAIPFFDVSDNSEIYILNKYDSNCFDIINELEKQTLSDNNIYKNILKGKTSFNTVNKNGSKSIAFAYSSSSKLLDYTYYAIVPYKNIALSQMGNILVMLLLLIITILLTLIIAKYIIKHFFTPIKKLESVLDGYKHNTVGNLNFLDNISNTVNTLVTDFNNLEKILPYTQKQYILDFLNDFTNSSGENPEVASEFKLPFEKNNFEMLIVQIEPLQKLFNEFTQTEYERILLSCSQIIQDTVLHFIENAYFLTQEKESQYIIINTDEDDVSSAVKQIKETIADIFTHESDYIELYITNGNLYSGMDGLKQSYSEAVSHLSDMPIIRPDIVALTSNITKTKLFSNKDELNFLNMLLSNNTDKAVEFVCNVTEKFKNNNYILTNAYQSILTVIFKAMYMKGIPIASNNQSELDTYLQLFNAPANILHKKILLFINKFKSKTNISDEDLSKKISNYIAENYTDPGISLDSIASLLGVEKNTVSSIIKEHFGISFHSYLENIRIETAKKMIAGTNKNIQDILDEVGFTNKQTFIRSFKKITGCTPSQYRHDSKL